MGYPSLRAAQPEKKMRINEMRQAKEAMEEGGA